MILPDINLLVYAVDETSPYHAASRRWWDETLSSTQTVALCWPSILGFVRLVTNRRIFQSPMTAAEALDRVDGWLAQPNSFLVSPTPRHWSLLSTLLRSMGVAGNLTTDAHIAALAIEHGATLCSNDNDFARFEQLRWENPLR